MGLLDLPVFLGPLGEPEREETYGRPLMVPDSRSEADFSGLQFAEATLWDPF